MLWAGSSAAFAQAAKYDGRRISDVVIAFEQGGSSDTVAAEIKRTATEVLGSTYSTVKVRDAIERLYGSFPIISIRVEATEQGGEAVALRFVVLRKKLAEEIRININEEFSEFTEQELLVRLNLIGSGAEITEQILANNANVIQEYLRERGYYRAVVTADQTQLQNPNQVNVTFNVTPGEPARVDRFDIAITGFDTKKFDRKLKLTPGEVFTREALAKDLQKIKDILLDESFLAPRLNEPRVVYDPDTNLIEIQLAGDRGPEVEVIVEAERDKIGSGRQKQILPVKREGTIDYAAIVEGERRLENHYQEIGYFFVDVTAVCSVDPPLQEGEATVFNNDSQFLCASLSSADLANKKVTVKYNVELRRKLKLVDIRLEGTDQFLIDEIKSVLETQEANIFGIIPLFGYGRGYTSEGLLEEDSETIRSLLRELGYRDATVRVNQGVSPDGENLIITFIVDQKTATVVSDVGFEGNSIFSDQELLDLVPGLAGNNFSFAKMRNAQRKIVEKYSDAGYFDATVRFSIDERTVDANTGEKLFSVKFNVENEGKKVEIGRVLVTGNESTKTKAIEKAAMLKSGDLLKATDIYAGEQSLYGSDVFSRVEVKTRPAGDVDETTRRSDVIIDVEEQPQRLLSYGGGYSTDVGLSGFVDLRHLNLLGNLWQGGGRLRLSQRQQLAQIDFVNPRFIKDGEKRFAPLTITAQYLRDETVTRFFRSTFDRGTFGIIQRIDENGNPIDEFGVETGSPTLHKFSISAETNKTLSLKNRSILFVKYRYEDVRLYNVRSLLIKDLLIPDAKIRISGFGATYVRDTRENCNIKYTVLDIIARGERGPECKYNSGDPTRGSYLTAEYNFSAKQLGGNIGFHKFQAAYNQYHTVDFLNKTTFAARGIIGLATVFAGGDRFDPVQFPGMNGLLPISERFFAGGSNTLRGFEFEEAGPRLTVVPTGTFRNSNGDQVFLDPFTVPIGGNALAILNLEARVPINESFRMVPFYDGGNVFRDVKGMFNPPDAPPGNVVRNNIRTLWSHTVGLGVRFKAPFGGEFGVDYGYLLNPPRFLIPQINAPNAIYQLPQGQIHFRFSQAF